MTVLARRRLRNAGLALVFVLLAVALGAVYEAASLRGAYFTGWTLLALTLLLALYQARKSIPTLPIGDAAGWLQVHVYAGLAALFVFFDHIGWKLPSGGFETMFGAGFFLVALSGAIGHALNRILPPRLRRRGEEVLYERIPAHRARLQADAEKMVRDCAADTASTMIQDFYLQKVARFMAEPRSFRAHLFGGKSEAAALLAEMDGCERYLGAKDKEYLADLRYYVERKDDLDFHHALQGVLKRWTFVHVPLVYAVLIGLFLHLVIVYAFSGGI